MNYELLKPPETDRPPSPEALRPNLEGLERGPEHDLQLALDQALPLVGLLHDFFRYGQPGMTEELECFLVETGSRLHAEPLLDDLAALIQAYGAAR